MRRVRPCAKVCVDGADHTARGIDTTLESDGACGQDIITGTHLDCDASLLTVRDGLSNTFTEGILDTSNTDKDEVLSEILVFHL